MKKIKIITRYPWSLNYGGAEIQAQAYKKYVNSDKYQIDFMDYHDTNLDYDIVHFIGLDQNTYRFASLAKEKGILVLISPVYYFESWNKLAFKAYNLIFRKGYKILNEFQKALLIADVILPNSHAEKKLILDIFGINLEKKIKIILNGHDECKTEFDNSFLSQYSIEEKKYFISCGMIDSRKNTHLLIDHFYKWKKNNKNDVKLVLLGDSRDKKYFKKYVNEMVNKNDSIVHISFTSDRDELYSLIYFSLGHALISDIETPGLVSLEARSVGTPILVGNCQPVKEYFGNYASYCDPKSYNQVKLFFDKNINSVNTTRNYNNEYLWEKCVKSLESIYDK